MDGTLTSGLFRITGIYKTSNTQYDEANVFVRQSDLVALINLEENACHEIAILLTSNDLLNTASENLKGSSHGVEVSTWRDLMPEVNLVEESMDVYMYFFLGIVLVALIFGIINTMLMAVLERTKELGMLMAVGMNKMRVFLMILLETVLLSFTGGIIGMLIAYVVVIYSNHQGIDLSVFAEGYEKLGYESIIYPVSSMDIHIKVGLMVLITGTLAAIYPAWKAIQLEPAEALHMDN
jgi:ABC-type lipoprotein release transport system permease subunit